jgi:glycosyltransferase involved in cell wall biosynthesis
MPKKIPPLLSIAIITYNNEKFINAAIESALAQDYPNIEIVISDDASTDDTVKIITKYIQAYPDKIRLLIAKKNMGAVANWFKCINTCRGKYIIGLGGDDEFYPNKVAKQVEIMENDPYIAICYADASVVQVSTQKELYRLSDKTPTKSGGIELALSDCTYYSPTMMFCKSLTPKENTFKMIRHGADLAFYKEFMILSAPLGTIYYLPEIVYKYQKHDMNITVTNNRYRREHIEAIKLLQKKYPKYSAYLNASIYDFCCVAFFKSILKLKFNDTCYFLYTGLKASRGNPFKFLRALIWGINFTINKWL